MNWVPAENFKPAEGQWCLLRIEFRYPKQAPSEPPLIQYDAARWKILTNGTGDWGERFRLGKIVAIAPIIFP